MGIGPVSCENCSVFKKGEGGPEAPGALRLRNKKATASVASSYSQPSLRARFLVRMMSGVCPEYVRLLSGYCPVTVRLLSGLLPADVQMDRT